jgi:hypothetical protein
MLGNDYVSEIQPPGVVNMCAAGLFGCEVLTRVAI